MLCFFFFSSRRRHTRCSRDWSSDVCSSDLPSTYATIISTLKARWYATAKDRRFAPTPLGETVWRVMKRSFPAVFDVGFTAQMENELDKVEEGGPRPGPPGRGLLGAVSPGGRAPPPRRRPPPPPP